MTGIRFSEVMIGRLGPQYNDPVLGHDKRNCGAVAASLAARIDIDDLDLFLARDLPHTGRLSVELSIPVLSNRPFAANDGCFELFRPGEIPSGGNGFFMVYDAEITDGDRVYQMTARKYLRPRRLWGFWRLWPETTTLYMTLRDVTPQRADPSDVDVSIPDVEPVPDWLVKVRHDLKPEPKAYRDFHQPAVAAGVVRLSLWGFIGQIVGMKGVDTSWYAKPFAKARFMAFFAGSLVRIYVLRKRSAAR